MANTYSALKRVRETERRTEYNRQNKTRLRHQIRAMRKAITSKDAKVVAALLPKTFSLIDRWRNPGSSNTAARYKPSCTREQAPPSLGRRRTRQATKRCLSYL